MFNLGRIHQAVSTAISLGVVLGLSGCGSEESSSKFRDPVEYIKESCEYSADDGKEYSTVQSTIPVISGYFGKTYNKDWLLNVGHTSMRDTVEKIETTGAKVYHANAISQKSCRNYGFTSALPADLGQEWRHADVRGPKGEFAAGLYLIKGTRALDSLKSRSAIIVREDANRWTLVHEFMHHNFKVQAVLRGYDDDAIRGKSNKLFDVVTKILNNPDLQKREKVKMATPLFLELIEVVDELMVQYSLEEMAVEATLQDKYNSGDLTFVPAGSYENASWYIKHSKEKAVQMYASLEERYSKLRELALFSGANPQYHQLYRHKELKEKRLAQIAEMLKEREDRKFRLASFTQIASQDSPSEGMAPCAQAAAIEKVMDELTQPLMQ